MKKITLAIALIAGSLIAKSQNTENNNGIIPPNPIDQSKFSFGVKGGFGHSFIIPYQNYLFNPSYNGGLSVVYSPWTHWGIGMDAIYSSEGATFKNGDTKYTSTLGYIRVPIKGIYYFNNYEHDFRPKVAIGPTVGFLVNETNGKYAQSFDMGANLSVGFNYRLARAVWLSADLNYYQGFLDVYSDNNEKDLNGNVRIDLGLSFGF